MRLVAKWGRVPKESLIGEDLDKEFLGEGGGFVLSSRAPAARDKARFPVVLILATRVMRTESVQVLLSRTYLEVVVLRRSIYNVMRPATCGSSCE